MTIDEETSLPFTISKKAWLGGAVQHDTNAILKLAEDAFFTHCDSKLVVLEATVTPNNISADLCP